MLKHSKVVRCVAPRTQHLAEELGKILPAFTQQTRAAQSTGSLSSIAVASARGAAFSATATHSSDCPVRGRRLPLGLIAKEPSFLKKPCEVCLAARTHFVASELYAREFGSNCRGTAQVAIPAALEAAIINSFGTLEGLRKAMLNFCTGSLAPGRTWLVCRRDATLAVVTMPGVEIPQTLGLWPLAVIEMSEAVLCQCVEAKESSKAASPSMSTPPTWSRAARNPSSTVTSVSHSGAQRENLGRLREAAAMVAFETMNWSFVEKQLSSATTYFRSEARLAKQKATRTQQERDAARNALKHINTAESGADDELAADTFDVEAAVRIVGTHEPAEPTDKAVSAPKPSQTPAVASVSEPAQEPVAETDPVTVQLPDGVWEYRYKNGDVTRLYSDGKKVFETHGLTTTVFANTDTLFEYANKTTILDRADGVRVTTFPDGRKTEERIN